MKGEKGYEGGRKVMKGRKDYEGEGWVMKGEKGYEGNVLPTSMDSTVSSHS